MDLARQLAHQWTPAAGLNMLSEYASMKRLCMQSGHISKELISQRMGQISLACQFREFKSNLRIEKGPG